MSRKLLLSLLSFSVFMTLFIISAPVPASAGANDTVYSRNGEVYVMIGAGARMGVYSSQELVNGVRVTKKPDGVKLFGDPTKMDNYQSLAVDQFRNIYVLSGKLDPGLINIPEDSYFPVDPPLGEGIVGIGKKNGVEFHDIVNHYDAVYPNHHQSSPMPARASERRASKGFSVIPGVGGTPNVPPVVPTGVDANGNDILTMYQNKYPQRKGSIKRIPLDYWYQGLNDWTVLDNGIKCGYANQVMQITWQIKFNVKVQRVNLWISHYINGAYIPAGVVPTAPPDPVITPNAVNDMFESVFHTTNLSYTRQRSTSCAESNHPGFLEPTPGTVNTDYKIGFTTTGAGRRYVYSSLPSPKIKKGTIKLVANNTYGIPQMDSADFNGLHGSQPLTAQTYSIGAATKNAAEDFVYTAPLSHNGWDVIGFAVADQWDGTGGVRYMLLQSPGNNAKFKLELPKKLKWNKMAGYTPDTGDPVKDGIIDLPNDVKVIAGDGSGSIYYLTEPRAQFDAAGAGDTFWGDGSTVSNLKPLANPGRPDGPKMTSDGRQYWVWYRKYSARAATELHQVEYYTKTKTLINNFTVGTNDALVMETFSDANGNNLINRGEPMQFPPGISNIKLALATINLAGPPTGNDEKMVADVVSSNATTTRLKEAVVSKIESGALGVSKLEADEIAEDTQYRSYVENAPLQFSNDLVKKNIISGVVLKDENANGIKGGFDFAVRPSSCSYYWRVEMVEPMKKVLTPDPVFVTSTTPARNVTLTKATAAPDGWAALAGKKESAQAVNFADGYWYFSKGANVDRTPAAEDPNAAEPAPDFAFTPKEPGIYKVSLIATAKKWNYDVLGYPSYITDRETAPGCKDAKNHFLFFDNGEGGGIAGDGIMNGGEDYISKRYVVVTAKQPEPDKYITKVKIDGPAEINENQAGVWTASANIRFIKSFNHEVGTPNAKLLMETYNGVGHWDYPATAVADWGLPAFDGVGEDYVTGAPAQPSNCYSGNVAGKTGTVEAMLRNFGEKPPGALQILPPPAQINAGAAKVWGTTTQIASWVDGAGTNANPTMALNKADRGCIEYEWYLAAEQKDGANGQSKYVGTQIDNTVSNVADPKRCPGILIAKGRLSDEKPFPGDAAKNAVTWVSGYVNADRRYDVNVNLRYAFDMPLDPGNYFLYIKFKYPKLKWEGRSPKKDKDGNLVKDAAGNQIFAYFDLVSDGFGETIYHTDNWLTVNNNVNEPAGFRIKVKDLQPPQAYFICENAALNPDSSTQLNGAAPAGGVMFKGATTGDPFPGFISYKVCDNNPNLGVSSSLMAKVGAKASALAWKEYQDPTDVQETEDVMIGFDLALVRKVLEKTINPIAAVRPPGVVQDAKIDAVNLYPGYGVDAPYRQAIYKIKNSKLSFTKAQIPYDMTGNIPLYAAGADGSNNKMSDFNKNGQLDELLAMVDAGKDESKVNEKKFPGAPASLVLVDNDAPSLRFYALRTRDNIYREYIVAGTGAPDANGRVAVHNSNYDELDWDAALPGKLIFTTQEKFDVTVRDCDLTGQTANIEGQNNPVHPTLTLQFDNAKAMILNKIKRASANDEVKVEPVGAIDNFKIRFNGKNTAINPTYNDFSPVEALVFDFDKILTGGGSTLEVVEDARTKLELTIADNVDGVVTPVLTALNSNSFGNNNCYVDTENLADADTLAEVMTGWRPKPPALETYGIFRNPTPLANRPFLLVSAKDKGGNSTTIRLPMSILHTLFKKNVLNVESKRSQ